MVEPVFKQVSGIFKVSSVNGRNAYFFILVTRLKKTSDCFLQWRDKDYGKFCFSVK